MIPARQRVAIVIPYYKIKFFEESLQCLAEQTDKNFKVYIGDDGSSECPAELISRYESQLHISYKRFDENLGGTSLVSHWHRCLDMMTDEKWVMLLGDDDFLNPNCVEELLKTIGSSDGTASVYRFATEVIDERSGDTSGPFKGPDKESCFEFIERKFLQRARSSLSEYVFRADLLKARRFRDYPLAWFADVMAVFEVSEGRRIEGINSAIVRVTVSSQSISGSDQHKHLKMLGNIAFCKDILSRHSKSFSPKLIKKIVGTCEANLLQSDFYTIKELLYFAKIYAHQHMILDLLALARRLPIVLKARKVS